MNFPRRKECHTCWSPRGHEGTMIVAEYVRRVRSQCESNVNNINNTASSMHPGHNFQMMVHPPPNMTLYKRDSHGSMVTYLTTNDPHLGYNMPNNNQSKSNEFVMNERSHHMMTPGTSSMVDAGGMHHHGNGVPMNRIHDHHSGPRMNSMLPQYRPLPHGDRKSVV